MKQTLTLMTHQLVKRLSCLSAAVALVLIAAAIGQAQDAVFKLKTAAGKSKISGKITSITPDGVTVDGTVVPSSEIRKLSLGKEPSGLGRARERMEAGRYADCIAELEKIKPSDRSTRIQPEIDFLRAYSNSQISLRGGNVTAQSAGTEIRAFIKNHPASYHLYPAMEQYGKQLFAFGELELSAEEFKKLGDVSWNEYKLKGLLGHARILIQLGRYPEAEASLDGILKVQSNDDMTQAYQLYARCGKAEIMGLNGDVEGSKKAIDQMILDQDSDNKPLFARLYNALGAVYEKSGKLKHARMAYMHTELLYANEADFHAEALYHLALIWPKLDKTDRASRARDTLKSRYRNSYWAGKL